jgi:hypothetical protein
MLSDIIGAADMINHLVPPPEDLVSGINRLVFAGLVAIDDERRFSLTSQGRTTMEATDSGRSWIAQWDALIGRLGRLPEPPTPLWERSQAELNEAYEAYRRAPGY